MTTNLLTATLRTALTLVAVLLTTALSSAQNIFSLGDETAYIEKLRKETEGATDSVRAYESLRLSLLYRRAGDPEKSKTYLDQGVRLGSPYPFIRAASAYYRSIVEYASRDIGMLEKGLLNADSLLSQFDHQEAYRLRGILWNNYGIVQQMKGNEKAAMEAFTTKAVYYAQRSKDAFVLAKAYKAIAIVFMNANQRDKASAYLRKAIEVTESSATDNPVNLAEQTETYITAAENYARQDVTDSAAIVLNKAKKILGPFPKSNLYLIYYNAEGVLLHKQKRYTEALSSVNKGIALASSLNAIQSLNRLNYAKYQSLSSLGRLADAANVLTDLIASPATFITDKKIYYKELFTIHTRLGNADAASTWAAKYIALSDSLYEAKFQKDIVELEKKYRETENEKKIAELQAKEERASLESRNSRLLNWLLATVILFLAASSFLSIMLYRNSRKLSIQREVYYQRELQEAEHRQQMQVAKALMKGEEVERKRLATDLHDGLGGRLAGIKINLSRIAAGQTADAELDSVIRQLDISSNELRRIARNLMPELLLRLGLRAALLDMCDSLSSPQTRVSFQGYEISEELSPEVQIHVYRIVQELITNAIRHGQASEVLVQCSQNGDNFYITVEDNGAGFDTSALDSKSGVGLMSIRNRVDFLAGKFDIASTPNEGTTVNIEFELHEYTAAHRDR